MTDSRLAPPRARLGVLCARPFVRLHRDERGTLSALTVVTILGLLMLLGMVINVGRHLDDKVKMQNAADAATYSGGVVLARGMNALSFSNHLLSDVFALTAFMREARDRNAESLVPDVLAAWSRVGPIFSQANFPKFKRLGPAITNKVPLEQAVVKSYSELLHANSELVLPVLEYVLRERLIPEFERAVVQTMPQLAQQATAEIARRHGVHRLQAKRDERYRGIQAGVLWRTSVMVVGYPDERDPLYRTLPAIDPTPGAQGNSTDPVPDPHPDPLEGADYQALPQGPMYLQLARQQRESLARSYLEQWTQDRLRFFAVEAKMSQFINLWRIFTCGQLMKLLNEEYPMSNLPHLLRLTESGIDAESLRKSGDQGTWNPYLDRNFMFVGTVHRKKMLEMFNGIFKNPMGSDPLTFSQIHLFIPRPRMWHANAPSAAAVGPGAAGAAAGGPAAFAAADSVPTLQPFQDIGGGGVGIDVPVSPGSGGGGGPGGGGGGADYWYTENWPPNWDLLNQNWTVQLVPATTENLTQILQTAPPPGSTNFQQPVTVRMPYLGGAGPRDVRRMNTH